MSFIDPNVVDGYCTPGTERETQWPAEQLLQTMDELGIRRAVIAPQDREIVVENTKGNDRVLKLAGRFPDRFIPACTVNPWRGGGCEELRRAVQSGARMLVLAPALQGFLPCDELADDLLSVAGQLRVPVYVHTGPHGFGAPTQLLLAAQRHAATRFIVGHCGSSDYWHDMAAVLAVKQENLWYESSFVRPWAVSGYAELIDRTRFIFGSGVPRENLAFDFKQLQEILPVAQNGDFYGGNLLRLLNEVVC